MRTSGIATVYNEEESIDYFIQSYIKQSKYCDELIIIDGLSTDKTVDILKSYQINNPEINLKVYSCKNSNSLYSKSPIAEGRNIAISKSKFNAIICFDFGCEYSFNYVEEMHNSLEKNKTDIVGGFFSAMNTSCSLSKLYSKYFMPKKEQLKKGFVPSSRSLAFMKDAWSKINGYNTKYITGEDTDFILRALKSGSSISYNVNLNVRWSNPSTSRDVFEKHRSYARGKAVFRIRDKFFLRVLTLFFPVVFVGEGFYVKYLINLANVVGFIEKYKN